MPKYRIIPIASINIPTDIWSSGKALAVYDGVKCQHLTMLSIGYDVAEYGTAESAHVGWPMVYAFRQPGLDN
jgi:hypothetical protein